MKILVIGSGGREHALVWKLKQSPRVTKIYCAQGNAGIAQHAELVDISPEDFPALAKFIKNNDISLTIVGPEVPLAEGITDFFNKEKLPVFGPNKNAARLESSKVFSKEFMKRHNVLTALFESFSDYKSAQSYIERIDDNTKLVVKADGLAAGKGVLMCDNKEQALDAIKQVMADRQFGTAGNEVVIESFLDGEEASLQVFVDGSHYAVMAAAQDHKRIFDQDQGPNTGGMGAYAPAPVVTNELLQKVEKQIIQPIMSGLKKESIDYRGVLYIGLMIVNNEPYVLEFNCRFGDPETQVVLPLLKSDLLTVIEHCINGTLDKCQIEWYNKTAVSVVLAAKGYPGSYEKGKEISGISEAEQDPSITVFQAGVAVDDKKALVTSGGRVLAVTGTGTTVREAIDAAYKAVKKVSFEGMQYRKDIGERALKRI